MAVLYVGFILFFISAPRNSNRRNCSGCTVVKLRVPLTPPSTHNPLTSEITNHPYTVIVPVTSSGYIRVCQVCLTAQLWAPFCCFFISNPRNLGVSGVMLMFIATRPITPCPCPCPYLIHVLVLVFPSLPRASANSWTLDSMFFFMYIY